MKAFVHWQNGHVTKVTAYYNESVESFESRLLRCYGHYSIRIMLCTRENEGFYIK